MGKSHFTITGGADSAVLTIFIAGQRCEPCAEDVCIVPGAIMRAWRQGANEERQ